MLVLILLFVVFCLWWILTYRPDDKSPRLPPCMRLLEKIIRTRALWCLSFLGPYGRLPFIGHLWRLDAVKPFETIDFWSREYGDVFSLFFGSQRVIVISRARLMREAFLKQADNFSGRPVLFVHESCWGKGLIISDGMENAEMRRFLGRCLRQKNGDAHNGIQIAVHREISKMVNAINEKLYRGENHLNIEETLFYVVGNVLTSFLLGRTYPHGSEEFKNNSQWLQRTLNLMERTAPLTFLPWLRYMPPDGFGYWKMKSQAAEVHETMKQELLQRIKTQDYKDESRDDLTSVFLRKMEEVHANKSATLIDQHNFCVDKIAMLMTELFFAGIQTECNTFGWAFLYFIEFPDIQEKCRKSILHKFGAANQIRWKDRTELPYVEATVMEVQRCANIAPFSVFHRNYHATTLDGYYIPANSVIMMNLYSTLVDPSCFRDPYAFKPERFLDNNGELSFEKMHGLYPYGLGRRICMGENIARCELFTVICALLQRYRFRKIPGRRYSLEKKMELTIHPDKYELLVERL